MGWFVFVGNCFQKLIVCRKRRAKLLHGNMGLARVPYRKLWKRKTLFVPNTILMWTRMQRPSGHLFDSGVISYESHNYAQKAIFSFYYRVPLLRKRFFGHRRVFTVKPSKKTCQITRFACVWHLTPHMFRKPSSTFRGEHCICKGAHS